MRNTIFISTFVSTLDGIMQIMNLLTIFMIHGIIRTSEKKEDTSQRKVDMLRAPMEFMIPKVDFVS